jgi:hypothetical protein
VATLGFEPPTTPVEGCWREFNHFAFGGNPEDVASVTNDITAHIPGTFDPSNNTITPPADGLQRDLYDMVSKLVAEATSVVNCLRCECML